MDILDYFEGDEYRRELKQVYCDNSSSWICYDTYAYIWSNPVEELEIENEWDYEYFSNNHLDWYLMNVVTPCEEEFDRM